jgi:hypothetical protein
MHEDSDAPVVAGERLELGSRWGNLEAEPQQEVIATVSPASTGRTEPARRTSATKAQCTAAGHAPCLGITNLIDPIEVRTGGDAHGVRRSSVVVFEGVARSVSTRCRKKSRATSA